MNTRDTLHHKLIELPQGKTPGDVVGERHEFVLLFDCAKSNPNGDPDTGNMPRVQPDSLKGLVTDVCLKRKIRNFFSLYSPHGAEARAWTDGEGRQGYDIFVREGAIHERQLNTTHQALCRRVVTELLDELSKVGFLKDDSRKEIEDGLADADFPPKPEDCESFVLDKCKGKLDFTTLPQRVRERLGEAQGIPAEVAEALQNLELPEKARDNEEEARKAVEKVCKEKAPKGRKPAVSKALKEIFAALSPAALVSTRFTKLNLEKANREAVCDYYFDVRAFGAVVSTEGPLSGSSYGQIRGPIQFTFSESLDRVLPLDATITRCSVANEALAKKKEREFGRKYGIDYGLYRCHIHFSPAFAAKTRFTYYDLDNFLFALVHMFDDDHAAGRHLRLVGLVDFQHQSALGNAPAHKLFELVQVEGVKKDKDGKPVFASSDSEFPRGLNDYAGEAPEGELHVTRTGEVKPGKNGEGVAVIKAKRLVWEIPPKQSNGKSS
jgi:CRISPR-associated protein Csd2